MAFRLLACVLLACGGSSSLDCPDDGVAHEDETGRYCAYIVVRGGFDCPDALPHRIDFADRLVCTDRADADADDLPPEVCVLLGESCELDAGTPDVDAAVPGPGGRPGVCCPFSTIGSCDCSGGGGGWAESLDACPPTNICDIIDWTEEVDEFGCTFAVPTGSCIMEDAGPGDAGGS